MKLIDRLSLGRVIQMVLDFILKLVDKLQNKKIDEVKKKRRWRKTDE